MKCDTDPVACAPCRLKSLRCFTTDRVTGYPRERGMDADIAELSSLRDQVQRYQNRFGPLRPEELAAARNARERTEQNGPIPSSKYVGWPAPNNIEPLCKGPITGTKVDTMDGIIDVADFKCESKPEEERSNEPVFNASRSSIVSTIFGYQRVENPTLPTKTDGIGLIEAFLVVMSQYYPVVHRNSFKDLALRFYDQPENITIAERVQVILVFAIMNQQSAVRNHATTAECYERSHQYLHYALGFYRDVYHDVSLESMQALSLLVLYFRNLPKPGVSWSFSHQVLVRTIELQYNRDPDAVVLPPAERTVLAKELRKRVFHAVLGVCVTTGCRVGLAAPWQFQQFDVPLPAQITDDEISMHTITANRSGRCDFHPAVHLSKLIPLLTELYNHVLAVRRPDWEYLKIVDALNGKILAWRQDWEESMKAEQPMHVNLHVATLLIEQWAAEYQMMLHHPSCCSSIDSNVIDRHLETCHKAAKRMLSAFHTLSSKYNGVDFTWHSTAPYAMAFGLTLHYYQMRLGQVSREQYESMCNELKGWMSLMAYADVVLRTNNHLQKLFRPRQQAVERDYKNLMDQQAPMDFSGNVNGNTNGKHRYSHPNIKAEPTPLSMNQALSNNTHNIQASMGGAHAPPPSSMAAGPGSSINSGQWTGTPQAASYGTGVGLQNYSAFPQPNNLPIAPEHHQMPAQTGPQPQYSPYIPVSLAPLLNERSSVYQSYASASQAPTQTTGATVDYSLLPFNSSQYYETNGQMSWPLITMPPGRS